jgi:superfamily II DNA or RNA helicase
MEEMDIITVKKKNHAMLSISTEPSIDMELSSHFEWFVPGYKFMPQYKNRMWDGKFRLYNTLHKEIPAGVYDYVKEFADVRGYTLNIEHCPTYGSINTKVDIDINTLARFIQDLTLTSKGVKIEPREYQLKGILHAIHNKASLLLSPTASGKSLIIYCTIRWYLENYDNNVLLVVPTTSLVEQMYSDFADYSMYDDTWDVEEYTHRIYSGKERNTDKRIVITTWQSIYKMQSKWFEPYSMVIGDEAHTFKAKSLTSIMSKLRDADFRIGTTGTIPDQDSDCHKLILEGHFGPIYKVTSTKELMDAGTLAQMSINILLLKYPEVLCKSLKKATYQEEIDFIVSNKERNNFIKNLALDQDGNTLVLFNLVKKHGEPLYKMISEKSADNRKVFFVSGSTPTDDRERIRQLTEKENDAIIVASLGTFSTGINIKNLHNIIFASPSKSQIKVLQSIGRGLRKSETGQGTEVFDIADDLHYRKKQNYTLIHSGERIKIYSKEQFEYDIYEVQI